MNSNDIFKAGTKIQWVMHQGVDHEEASEILESARHLMYTQPIITRIPKKMAASRMDPSISCVSLPEVGFDLKLIKVQAEKDIETNSYIVTAVGVII